MVTAVISYEEALKCPKCQKVYTHDSDRRSGSVDRTEVRWCKQEQCIENNEREEKEHLHLTCRQCNFMVITWCADDETHGS